MIVKKSSSILFKISLAFGLMYIISTLFFYYGYQQAKDKEIRDFIRRGLLFVYSNNPEDLGQNIAEITDIETAEDIITNSRPLLERNLGFIQIKVVEYEEDTYLILNKFGTTYILKKNDSIEIHKLILIGYLIFNIAFILLYINIVKSFYPLKQLRDKIRILKSGNLNVDVKIDKDDEIGFIAREFNEAIKSLKKNEEIRKWFLRNIAHELKTPITKGKIAIELLNDDRGKENFEKIFNRLEYLINQLLLVEKITSEKFNLNRECVNISQVINNATELLLISEKNLVEIELTQDDRVFIDISLFSIAIKNLIDNGIKFSEDGICKVSYKDGVICISNRGEKPSIDVDILFEPFVKETSLKNKEGLGLGLYITKFVVQSHGLNLSYRYENGENFFCIDFKSALC
ncbi:MAG: ArsS family sensor histidine kinase [Hydrogenothermaceae bacterium]